MEHVPKAALISRDPDLLDRLAKILRLHGLHATRHDSLAQFELTLSPGTSAAFHHADHKDQQPHVNAYARPDVIIVDVDDGTWTEELEFVLALQGDAPSIEVLLLWAGISRHEAAKLVLAGAGNVLRRERWYTPERSEKIARTAHRLGVIAVGREQARRRDSIRAQHYTHRPRAAFLCHADSDEVPAWGLRRYLEVHGIETWYTFADEGPYNAWRLHQKQALEEAKALIVVASESAVQSPACIAEIGQYASQHGARRVLPIHLTEDIPKDVAELLADYPQPWHALPRLGDRIVDLLLAVARLAAAE